MSKNDINSVNNVDQVHEKLNKVVNERIFNEFGNYTAEIRTNQTEYKPGETVQINTTTSYSGINGSVSWSFNSPLNENALTSPFPSLRCV